MLANGSPVPSGVPKRGEFAADDPQDGPLEYVVGGRFIDTLLDYDDEEEEKKKKKKKKQEEEDKEKEDKEKEDKEKEGEEGVEDDDDDGEVAEEKLWHFIWTETKQLCSV